MLPVETERRNVMKQLCAALRIQRSRAITASVLLLLGLDFDFRAFAAASASAGSAGFLSRPAHVQTDNEWFNAVTAAAAKYEYHGGENVADLARRSKSYPRLDKFDLSSIFTHHWPQETFTVRGNKGSVAETHFKGSSDDILIPIATMTVTATGFLGSPAPAEYRAKGKITDPWPAFASGFNQFPGETFDLFVPFAILGGNSAGSGQGLINGSPVAYESGFGFEISYETAEGTANLLSIQISGRDVSVDGNSSAAIQYFRLDPTGLLPATDSALEIGLDEIRSLLVSDLADDMEINTPLGLGILWNDLPKPTQPIGDVHILKEPAPDDLNGAPVALLHVDEHAYDGAASEGVTVPETGASAVLLGFGCFCMFVSRIRFVA